MRAPVGEAHIRDGLAVGREAQPGTGRPEPGDHLGQLRGVPDVVEGVRARLCVAEPELGSHDPIGQAQLTVPQRGPRREDAAGEQLKLFFADLGDPDSLDVADGG